MPSAATPAAAGLHRVGLAAVLPVRAGAAPYGELKDSAVANATWQQHQREGNWCAPDRALFIALTEDVEPKAASEAC